MRSDSSAYLATKASKDDSARDILQSLATAAAGLCGLAGRELDLFHALIARESTWRHYDAQGRVLRSSAGALGLAQVMPATARELGLDARDVWQNAFAGACTLRRNLDRRGGDHRKALHDYHAGAWRKRTTRATHDYSDDIMRGSAQ
jgi:soluble lytic murein transglycosylase-like protein